MPEGINVVIRQRRAVVRVVEQAAKPLDTAVEKLQRRLKRMRALRRKVPTTSDFSEVMGIVREILSAVQGIDQAVGRAVGLFGDGGMQKGLVDPIFGFNVGGGSTLTPRPSPASPIRGNATIVRSGNKTQVWTTGPDGGLIDLVWEGSGAVPAYILKRYRIQQEAVR